MSRLTWARAKLALAGLPAAQSDQWPPRLVPAEVARLQGWPTSFEKVITDACAAGELQHEMVEFVDTRGRVAYAGERFGMPGVGRALEAPAKLKLLPAVTATDFVAWLRAQDEKPSELVAAWLEAAGRVAAPAPPARQPVSSAAAKVRRQDERLASCEDEGIVFDKYSMLRLPDGIGGVAAKLGMTRQALAADVKAALKRRFDAQRQDGA